MSKIIDIVDPQAGTIREKVVESGAPPLATEGDKQAEQEYFAQSMVREGGDHRALGLGKYRSLREAATTSQFPALLRVGLKQILFAAYNEEPTTYQEWVQPEPSDKPAEDWLEMNRIGTLPQVGENNPYPEIDIALDRTVRIANAKYGQIFAVTEEMVKFDKSNQIRQFPLELGPAAKQTIEATCYGVLTTAGNYTRNSTTGDNDVGANTAATTFSATGLLTAFRTLRTTKDNKSGRYLNIVPDTLIVTPGLEWAAKMLVLAPELVRQHGATSAEVYGTGQANPMRGLVNRIIVSPWLGTTYQWVLMKAKRAVVYQEVEPLQLLTKSVEGNQLDEAYFIYDRIRYRVRVWFGVGMLNDRFAYYSSATAAPAVA